MGYFDDPRLRSSQELSFLAEQAAKAGRSNDSRQLYAQAASLEEAVAREVRSDSPRIKGLLSLSAVSLWSRAAEWSEVERASTFFLMERDTLPTEAVEKIRRLLYEALEFQRVPEAAASNYNQAFDILRPRMFLGESLAKKLPTLDEISGFLTNMARAFKKALDAELELFKYDGNFLPVSFAHTGRGSFVIRLESPVIDLGSQEHNLSIINRKVFERIVTGIRDAELATEYTDSSLISDNYEQGFDADLCKIFADICKSLDEDGMEFSTSWSQAIAPSKELKNLSPIKLTPGAQYYLKSAAETLSKQKTKRGSVEGGVILLSDPNRYSESGLREDANRKIVVAVRTEKKYRNVSVYLSPEDYELAVQAHGQKQMVRAHGTLDKTTSRWRLYEVDKIEIAGILTTPLRKYVKKAEEKISSGDPIEPQESKGSKYALIKQLKRAVIEGKVPKTFTTDDYRNWVDTYKPVQEDGQPFASGSVSSLLSNYREKSSSTTRGSEKGQLRRDSLPDGTRYYWFEDIGKE